MSAEEIAELRHMNIAEADRVARKLNLQVLYDREHSCDQADDKWIFQSPFRMTLTGEQKVRNEDGELVCTHEGADDLEIEPPCCDGRDCGCRGMHSITCRGCNNDDMSDDQANDLIEAYLEDRAEAKAGYYD